MTIVLLLVLALVAALFIRLRPRRVGTALGIVVAVAFVATGYGLPARLLLASLQNGYSTEVHAWGARNAIILLGAGTELADHHAIETGTFGYSRLVKALQLYHSCRTQTRECRIIATGGDVHAFGESEAQVFAAQLQSLGVPAEDLLLETRSLNTWQNAQLTAPFFAHHAFDRAFLVTSGVHLRRAALYFKHFGIRATPIRSDYGWPASLPVPTAYNFFLTDIALHEYAGVLRYHLYNALGWNVKAVKPGAL